ncbi:MAG: vitamin B12-dependent ribonucleotide reductase, partial [Chthonomonadaceae bacterium]|nr:vitamin B12-dependent ribonucleotide reductase [Chthonomonadaceae bacterium]
MQEPTSPQTDISSVMDSTIENEVANPIPAKGRVKVSASSPKKSARGEGAPGLSVERRFTKPGEDVYSTVEWELRDAIISNERGEKVFEQTDVEIPKSWTQLATNVVVSKYFRGHIGTANRERSVRQLIRRVSDTIANWGRGMDYFATEEDAQTFNDELTHILLYQKAAFNSPVWFNVGLPENPHPQCSACFINAVDDTMESILTLAKTEGMLFKFGSGTGTNLSSIRSSREHLQGGGTASGPLSFMRGFDQFAGAIKSGGKTRRAAKMVMLDIDHPDIEDFITCKSKEEKKAWALIDAGYSGAFNVAGGAYDSVSFQNGNNSVRVSDEFMETLAKDGDWWTRFVTTKEKAQQYKARDLMNMIAESAWICGDPGMQYDTTINKWHTCKNTSRIYGSNPCSEYMFVNDSACNLASLNLMKFRHENGEFDVEAFRHACRVVLTAQEIIVDNASYPTPRIEENSRDYRPLGLGYANLGALLMARGLAYDSDEGRAYAGAITAIMTGEGYHQSSIIARDHGWTFNGYAKNREPFLQVMKMHRDAVEQINPEFVPDDLLQAARKSWDNAIITGEQHGYRNAQATVLAPTGTIGFLMDCDTTGIEPDIAIVKYKSLVGGGMLKIVNNTVPEALRRLGYTPRQVDEIIAYIDKHDTIEGAPELKAEHLTVFDCAFKPANGVRSIHYNGHLKMMAAA